MTLYIKQKVFSWADRFTVKDKAGNDRYLVEGEIFTWGNKLHVCDVMNNEIVYIEQRLFTFLPRYEIFIGKVSVAELVKEFTFFVPRYTVRLRDGREWSINGEFFEHDYTVSSGQNTVVDINKEWFTWGDSYSLNIIDEADTPLALAVVLAIDAITEDGD